MGLRNRGQRQRLFRANTRRKETLPMRIASLLLAAAVAVHGCAPRDASESNQDGPEDQPVAATAASSGWDLQSSGEGVALALQAAGRVTAIHLFCSAEGNDLLVNV